MLKALWDMMNGKKFSTGTTITILAFGLQQIGIAKDQASNDALYIVQGVGAVIMVIGYIHQWIKARAFKLSQATPEPMVKP